MTPALILHVIHRRPAPRTIPLRGNYGAGRPCKKWMDYLPCIEPEDLVQGSAHADRISPNRETKGKSLRVYMAKLRRGAHTCN